jgi:transposase
MSNTLPVFVGLDYHQQSVQVCVLDSQGRQLLNKPLENDCRVITQAVAKLGTVRRAGIESCSGAADLAQELADQSGWSIDLAHPGYVSRMKQTPDKSDYSDGRMIADLVRVGYLPKVWLAPEPIRELRRMVRHRQSLVNERRSAKQRVNAILREQRLRCVDHARWTKAWMKWLDNAALSKAGRWVIDRQLIHLHHLCDEIERAEKQLDRMTRSDKTVQKLKTLPGIGEVTAWVIRATIGRFDRFATGKQLSRFCGLSPRNASSGTRVADAGLINAGDPLLRTTLIEMSHRLIRTEARWKELATKLRAAGKAPCVIAAAVANRYVRWMFHQMKENVTEVKAMVQTAVQAAAGPKLE